MSDWNWNSGKTEYERQREREEAERKKRDIEDIDGDINWAYSQMRTVEAWLEQAIEERGTALSEKDSKRLDKALVVARTGMKMLKKVVKSRAPHLDTRAWKASLDMPRKVN